MNRNDNTAAQEAEPVGYWVSIPDEPELGHWFSHRPCGEEGYLSLPLYAHPPRPQADARAADAPEGCTPTDAQILRKANHDLAAESFELQAALRGIVAQAGGVLARFDIAFQEDAGAPLTQAARDVLAERRRQVEAEGWTPEHDDEHDFGQLARAGAAYAAQSLCAEDAELECGPTNWWPWEQAWRKPNSRRGMLTKAGALILAEIERLDRAAKRAEDGERS